MRLKILFVFLVLGLLSSSALAVGFLGPSTAGLNKGQWSIGYNYSYSTQDLEKANLKTVTSDGFVFSDELKVEDFETQRHYGTLSYGMADWWEIYASVGVAEVEADVEWIADGNTYPYSADFDNDLAWGWGTRMTFAKGEKISWGAAVQMNWIDTEWSETSGTEEDEIDIDIWDIVVTVGPTIDMGGWKLYGGPFYYCLSGDWDQTYTDTSEGLYFEKASADVRADSNWGGYVGVLIPIAQNWDLSAEGSMTEDGWGVGGGLALKF